MTAEETAKLEAEKDALWRQYTEVRDKIESLKVEQLTEKYKGKYIKYNITGHLDTEPTYMFITNIWESSQDDVIYFEGDELAFYFCDYDDCTYFNWTPWTQNRLTAHDVRDEKWQDEHIKIITEEEYREAFKNGNELMLKRFNDDFEDKE